ncbi:hypothetical protein DFH09DRAFT_1128588, partial [Mycena vulgaris]
MRTLFPAVFARDPYTYDSTKICACAAHCRSTTTNLHPASPSGSLPHRPRPRRAHVPAAPVGIARKGWRVPLLAAYMAKALPTRTPRTCLPRGPIVSPPWTCISSSPPRTLGVTTYSRTSRTPPPPRTRMTPRARTPRIPSPGTRISSPPPARISSPTMRMPSPPTP